MNNLNNIIATLDHLITNGEISNIAYAEILESISIDDNDFLPTTYAEIDYGDREDAEAYDGARWDDMNYLYYRER